MLSRFVKWSAWSALLVCATAVVVAVALYLYVSPNLPSIEQLKDVRLQVPLRVYDREGRLIAEYGEKRREPLTIEQTPKLLANAFIAAEDDRFYQHPGVDYRGLIRAGVNLVMTGEKGQGGSTITMQVARNFFLSREKTYLRKINEIFLALKIERELSKDQILELYLNKIYMGNRAYGVGAAAQVYYGKKVDALNLAETAMIAGLPKAPSGYNPIANPQRALIRRNYVLGRMRTLRMIEPADYDAAVAAPVTAKIHNARREVEASYLGELVRAYVADQYGEDTYTSGLKVFTTIDGAKQAAANRALRKGLVGYEERHGYLGSLGRVDGETLAEPAELDVALAQHPIRGGLRPAVVTEISDAQALLYLGGGETQPLSWKEMEWARPRLENDRLGGAPKLPQDVVAVGDVIYVAELGDGRLRLAQLPEVEGALVALDPNDGAILALVGGFDFRRSKFNRAVQAYRQPGSNFKPFIYSAALAKGFTAATLINDAPVVFDDPGLESDWRPENYSGKFYGPTRLREALVKSRNLVSVRILISLGLRYAIEYAKRFGFPTDRLPRDLSLALGSGTVTPIQVATGYAVFANGGYLVEPYFIARIEDRKGELIYRANPAIVCPDCETAESDEARHRAAPRDDTGLTQEFADSIMAPKKRYAKQVIDPRDAYVVRTMLQEVIQRGTGVRAKVLGRNDLAGKTGTTNDQQDAWFSGFNSHIVATAWVGFDKLAPLGNRETGSRAALPIWIDFMKAVLNQLEPDKLNQPDGLLTMRIDRQTGELTGADNPNAMFEIFREESAPEQTRQYSGGGNAPSGDASEPAPEQLF